jgi:hypothetical protein
MKPHKHAELIKAWADGAEIQGKNWNNEWVKVTDISWDPDFEYRVKPEPKEDEPLFLDYFNTVLNKYCKLYLLLDGTTGDVKETKSMEIRI